MQASSFTLTLSREGFLTVSVSVETGYNTRLDYYTHSKQVIILISPAILNTRLFIPKQVVDLQNYINAYYRKIIFQELLLSTGL